jgi:nucleoside-diphosphate-sugar epimerase
MEKHSGKNGNKENMKTLIIGNEGYIGPHVVNRIKQYHSNSHIAGFDLGYFAHNITAQEFPELNIDVQFRGDVRNFPQDILKGFDSVIYLAAISNDPMGKEFEQVTYDVNQHSAISIAKVAKDAGVNHFVYASSCSVYGSADDKPRTENSDLNPLTAYAISKVSTEKALEPLASNNFIVTCLRFATACGFSPRLRLDLVLNDFVASALAVGKIEILSDGTPWRPLIHVQDMARAIDWAANRSNNEGAGDFLVVNTGSNDWNYQIKDLALAVKNQLSSIELSINEDAEPDKRSYQVDFSLFKKLAPDYVPEFDLIAAVKDLRIGLVKLGFNDSKFRQSSLIRLNVLRDHIENNRLNNNLEWLL